MLLFRIAILFSTLSVNAFAPCTLSLKCILRYRSTVWVFRTAFPFLVRRLMLSWSTSSSEPRSTSLAINVAANEMRKNELYTVLSRSTNFEYIRWDNRRLEIVYRNKENWGQKQLSVSHSEYHHSKFNKVVFKDGSVYIGITCGTLK